MTVPVGGDIGDEVRSYHFNARLDRLSAAIEELIAFFIRFTPSTKP